ncbi:MAG: peptide chain release factor 2 [Firmicutes bacterium]|nr:peptide chain release factor 2 [Bacillota bacterium]
MIEEIKSGLSDLRKQLSEAEEALQADSLRGKLTDLETECTVPGFWDDPERAQKTLKEKKSIENKLGELADIDSQLSDIEVMCELAEESGSESDAGMESEILAMNEAVRSQLEALTLRTLLTGEYDKNNAILSIHAGTGGVDANDWAEMLMRMYMRWCEAHDYTVSILDLQREEEAGIRNCTMLVEGENAYGYLRCERGVHRLVRISPFNAQNKRQTSFAKVEVAPEIDESVNVELDPNDLRIDTYRSSGAGGQHINKTDSAIRITHIPTGIVVTCQNERSQFQNKDMAMRVLIGKLTELAEREHKQNLKDLQGDFSENTWGSQIRNYVLQPYTLAKDVRTGVETPAVQSVLDGDLDQFINAMLRQNSKEQAK